MSMPLLLGNTYAICKALPKINSDGPIWPMDSDGQPLHKGQKLALVMHEKNMTQAQIAKEFGVAPPSVNEWFKLGRISERHYQKLVDWSGYPIEWWLNMRPVTAPPAVDPLSQQARVLASMFDALVISVAQRTRLFLALCEVISKYQLTLDKPPGDPATPMPTAHFPGKKAP